MKNAEKGNSILTWNILKRVSLFTSVNEYQPALLPLGHRLCEEGEQSRTGAVDPFSAQNQTALPRRGKSEEVMHLISKHLLLRRSVEKFIPFPKTTLFGWSSGAVTLTLKDVSQGPAGSPAWWGVMVPASPLGTALAACLTDWGVNWCCSQVQHSCSADWWDLLGKMELLAVKPCVRTFVTHMLRLCNLIRET